MRSLWITAAALVCLPLAVLPQQYRVSPQNMYHRVWARVPVIGAGTAADPKRPLFAPKPGETSPILGYSMVLSDDKHFALVQFVARDRASLDKWFGAGRADVKLFEKGKARRDEIETEFRQFRKNISLDQIGEVRP